MNTTFWKFVCSKIWISSSYHPISIRYVFPLDIVEAMRVVYSVDLWRDYQMRSLRWWFSKKEHLVLGRKLSAEFPTICNCMMLYWQSVLHVKSKLTGNRPFRTYNMSHIYVQCICISLFLPRTIQLHTSLGFSFSELFVLNEIFPEIPVYI